MTKEFSLASMDQGVSPISRVNYPDKGPPLGSLGYEIRQIFEFWSTLEGHETRMDSMRFGIKLARCRH